MYHLKKELETYSLAHPERKIYSEKCLELLQKYPRDNVFHRDCFSDGHFTAWVLVFNAQKTQVLLMKSKKSWKWQHFGGHWDGDTNLRNVAIREFEEESGINIEKIILDTEIWSVDVHIVLEKNHAEYWLELEHYHYDINYFWTADKNIVFSLGDEDVVKISWILLSDIQENRENFSTWLQAMLYKFI